MVEEVLGYDDIVQQYAQNIVLFKGRPVFVHSVSIGAPHSLNCTDLVTQKRVSGRFNMHDFTPPNMRIGMVNINGATLYVTRKPVRRMNVGINSQNLIIKYLDVVYIDGAQQAIAEVQRLKTADLGSAMLGIYPTFEESLEFVSEFKGAMAFDRQFAVCSKRKIHYKTNVVGVLARGVNTIDGIVFSAEFEHLELLLGDKCGQTLRAIG